MIKELKKVRKQYKELMGTEERDTKRARSREEGMVVHEVEET